MKLRHITLSEGNELGILQQFEHSFAPQTGDGLEPYCFVGANGTGKSRLLQCLAEIFGWLDARTRLVRPDSNAAIAFRFALEYELQVNTTPSIIKISNVADQNRPVVTQITDDGTETTVQDEVAVRAVLPRFIVGYTSGENETLSVPFLDAKQPYAAEVRERAVRTPGTQDDIPDLRLVMMDYYANFAIIAANFLLQPSDRLSFFKEYIRISDLESFRIVFQLNHPAAKRIKGVKLTEQLRRYVERLKKCAACYQYEEGEQRWTFDFFVSAATRDAFRHFFDNAYELCIAFQRLSMLNELMIQKKHLQEINRLRRSQKIVIKPPMPGEEDKVFRFETVRLRLRDSDNALDYISISDGEHQFAHIFGTLLMFDHPNVLFLFDEGESHFNPQWRIKFVPLVNAIASGKHQCLLLTSHAPFIISDCKAQNVYIFRRTQDGRRVTSESPKNETYGASFDSLLEDVFDVVPPIARKSLGELRSLQNAEKPEEIQNRLDDFGDSPEKFYLYQRMEKLKRKPK